MKILIIVILIIIIINIYYKINNTNEHLYETTDKTTMGLNNFSSNLINCANNIRTVKFTDIHTNKLYIDNKTAREYLLDICFPIGSFYVQFPDISHNTIFLAFPINQTPGKLFGGSWIEKFTDDNVFFRTMGGLSDENRDNMNTQDYALSRIYGKTAWGQADYNISNTINEYNKKLAEFQAIRDNICRTDYQSNLYRSYFGNGSPLPDGGSDIERLPYIRRFEEYSKKAKNDSEWCDMSNIEHVRNYSLELQRNYYPATQPSGVFYNLEQSELGASHGFGVNNTYRNNFDSSAVALAGGEVRVRNRILKIWTRVS
jgi:hypothetical protein